MTLVWRNAVVPVTKSMDYAIKIMQGRQSVFTVNFSVNVVNLYNNLDWSDYLYLKVVDLTIVL